MNEPIAIFYGWEVVEYFRYLADAYIRQFPWQVRIAFGLICIGMLTMLVLAILFAIKLRKRHVGRKRFESCRQRFEEPFRQILRSETKISEERMEEICQYEHSQFLSEDSMQLANLLVRLRMDFAHMFYIPNMQRLCHLTGVSQYLELNLLKQRKVVGTLQILMYLPCRVSEGALALYLENKNLRIRELARAYYGFCSRTEPFSMITKDVDKPFNMWYPTLLHRLCGWHAAKGHPMPLFTSLISQSNNNEKKALFIAEIPYYGSPEEKRNLKNYMHLNCKRCCLAAIHALALVGDVESVNDLVENYPNLFPEAKRETLLAVARINTGRQVDFFRKAYLHSTSRKTRTVALSCLLHYGEEGRRVFNELSAAGRDDNTLFEQVITFEERNID